MPIEPDSKDWTWVLQERCPECGFESWGFSRDEIGLMIRDNAGSWADVLSKPNFRARPNDTTWSALEYGCHVRDVFRRYDERLRLMLTESDPLYPNWDQDETALADRYDLQDPKSVTEELATAAEGIAARFDSVSGEGWERTGRRSDGASFTVETFARYFAHDWIHHLWDVTGG